MAVIEVTCPECHCSIQVDTASGKVVDHLSRDQKTGPSLEDFIKNQKNRGSALEQQFRKAKEDNELRKKKLEEQFRNAGDIAGEADDTMSSPFDWD